MKTLEHEIKKNGYKYTQLLLGEKAFIYRQDYLDGRVVSYEVFKRKEHKPYEIAGVYIDGGESFPSNESFGKWAWTYPTYEQALIKYYEISNV